MSQMEKDRSLPCNHTVLSMKLTPSVGSCVSSNVPSTYWFIRLVFPTVGSPSIATLIKQVLWVGDGTESARLSRLLLLLPEKAAIRAFIATGERA